MSPTTKPTIVLIPSSFCPSALLWDKTVDILHSSGYDTIAIELPTVGPPSTAPGKTMLDDAAQIHGIVEALADEGKDVMLVMHSYGGIPGTQSVHGLSRKERSQQGKAGGVVRLIYISALLINEGETSNDSLAPFTSGPPPFFRPAVSCIRFLPPPSLPSLSPKVPSNE
jgi:pimeloyl-ACP methyl ester carboxylesterase